MKKNSRGFSLLELLVALAIISILTTIAYPSYTHHLEKAQRAEAQTALMNLANRIERYYVENNYSYADATFEKLNINNTIAKNTYTLTIVNTTPTTYLLQATPNQDTICGALTLNEKGQKGILGKSDIKECW